jgi:hypothetical protein
MNASRPFLDHAPNYWGAGLSVVPSELGEKRPAKGIAKWQGYCNNLPSAETRADWLERYADRNIGLLMNIEILAGFRLGAVDVDRDELVGVIRSILGDPICGKRGRKGATFFVRVPNESRIKKTALADHAKTPSVDILVGHSHVVIPPSLHPEIGQPYTWIGKPLLDCEFDALPVLDEALLALMKVVVGSEYTPALLSGEETHAPGSALVAQLVSVASDDQIDVAIRALLPDDYKGNSLDELPGWISSARRKGFDRKRGGANQRQTEKEVLQSAIGQRRFELFKDRDSRAFISLPLPSGGQVSYLLRSQVTRRWLIQAFYEATDGAPSSKALTEVTDLLEARALHSGELRRVFFRVAGQEDRMWVDLGREDGLLIEIGPSSWAESYDAPVPFFRPQGLRSLPPPQGRGGLRQLQKLLGFDEIRYVLLVAFLLNCLRPEGPYFCLLVEGEQGSGKSFLCKLIRMIIDPRRVEKSRLPDNERDLAIQANSYFLLVFDNVSGFRAEISDALCSLATGSGFSTRKLYTDEELQEFDVARPFVVNGISGIATRPDLMERSIALTLEPMPAHLRRTEQQMLREFEALLPSILGDLFDLVSCALRNFAETQPSTEIRMADAAHWLQAAEGGTGFPDGTFIRALKDAQNTLMIDRVTTDPMVAKLLVELEKARFVGTIGELFLKLHGGDQRYRDRSLPPTPAHLSRHLDRQRPAMARAGIMMRDKRTRKGKEVELWLDGHEPAGSIARTEY